MNLNPLRWRTPSSWTMTTEVHRQIRSTIGCLMPETGGMLGGCRQRRLVTHFYFDGTAARTGVTYSPDTEHCNRVLTRDWNPAGVELMGFVHSHPHGFLRPSGGDLMYAQQILTTNPSLQSLLLPIVSTRPDSQEFGMRGFTASLVNSLVSIDRTDMLTLTAPGPTAPSTFEGLEMFQRVRRAYDLPRMERSRVIAVGCGGSSSFIEDLARAGVGQFVLIDPDTVSETNLATQQTYRSDLGRPKVDCIAGRLQDINPLVGVIALQKELDELDDVDLCYLAQMPVSGAPPATTLICGMTDRFMAQARVNRLALQFGLPSLCAQMHEAGLGAEITFTHPEITRACHRCVLQSRYAAYARGFVNHVGSQGSPYAATARLNALKQFVALALLHSGSAHPRWGGMLRRIGDRNLVQLRLDPDCELPSFERAFGGADPDRLLFDEAVWLRQEPQSGASPCPDCGGGGHLSGRTGTCRDTRWMPDLVAPNESAGGAPQSLPGPALRV